MEEQSIPQPPIVQVKNQSESETENTSFPKWPLIIIVLFAIIILSAGIYLLNKSSSNLLSKQTPSPTTTIPSSTSVSKTANWKTYKYSLYSLTYPDTWSEGQENGLPALTHQEKNEHWSISMEIISQEQVNLRGVTYCGTYPENTSRCETLPINNTVKALIDWGAKSNEEAQANIEISNPKGGIIAMRLAPVNPKTTIILRQILSTFKFTNQSPPAPEQKTACTQEAKMCPDGKTYVGRIGPNCEFAPCP